MMFEMENTIELFDVTDLYKEHFSGCPNETAYCSPYTLIRLLADLVPGLPGDVFSSQRVRSFAYLT